MMHTAKVVAADRHEGVTFEQLSELVHEVEISKTAYSGPPTVKIRAGYRGQLRSIEVVYEVMPADGARAGTI